MWKMKLLLGFTKYLKKVIKLVPTNFFYSVVPSNNEVIYIYKNQDNNLTI